MGRSFGNSIGLKPGGIMSTEIDEDGTDHGFMFTGHSSKNQSTQSAPLAPKTAATANDMPCARPKRMPQPKAKEVSVPVASALSVFPATKVAPPLPKWRMPASASDRPPLPKGSIAPTATETKMEIQSETQESEEGIYVKSAFLVSSYGTRSSKFFTAKATETKMEIQSESEESEDGIYVKIAFRVSSYGTRSSKFFTS